MRVSPELIQRKAMIYAEEKTASKGQMKDFNAREGWLQKFMSRNVSSLCRRVIQVQKNPEKIFDKEIFHIFHVCQ